MKRFWRLPIVFAGIGAGLLGSARIAYAHCPLCVTAVGAGILGAKSFGLGDGIVGLFVGAFAIATGIWIAKKTKARFNVIPLQTPLIVTLSWLVTVIPMLGLSNQMLYLPVFLLGPAGSLFNQVHFLSKFFLGSIIGGIVSIAALRAHYSVKAWHGKTLFPFQGIALTVLSLVIASGVLFMAWGGG